MKNWLYNLSQILLVITLEIGLCYYLWCWFLESKFDVGFDLVQITCLYVIAGIISGRLASSISDACEKQSEYMILRVIAPIIIFVAFIVLRQLGA